MAQVYSCVLQQQRHFCIEAENYDQVLDWIRTHSFQDVDNLSKEYEDEYDEWIQDPDWDSGYRASLKPITVLTNESEGETVTDKLERLKSLIEESNKVIKDVEAETKRMEQEHFENKKAQFQELCDFLKPYFELYKAAGNPKNKIKVSTDPVYEIIFGSPALIIKVYRNNGYVGHFDIRNTYKDANASLITRDYLHDTITHYLEEFMNVFNREMLEDGFDHVIAEALIERAERTDAQYQNAKSKLEKG